MTERKKSGSISRIKKGLQRFSQEAEGAVRRLREGRMGSPYHTPFQLAGRRERIELRHYRLTQATAPKATLVLLPPWPMSPEIFDIAPELSAISWLLEAGIDVWTLSASPQETEHTIDAALLALWEQAMQDIHQQANGPLHLAGYSHHGHWIYQLAAQAPKGLFASVIAFGVPVDGPTPQAFQRTRSLADRLLTQVLRSFRGTDKEPEQLPKAMGAYGVTLHEDHPREETHHLFRLLGLVPKGSTEPPPTSPDSEEPAAARGIWDTLGGWLSKRSDGLAQIETLTPSFANLSLPILHFIGLHDTLVPAQRIRQLAALSPQAEIHEVCVETGHFGLVVGPRAMAEVWPLLPQWMAWAIDAEGQPPFLPASETTKEMPSTQTQEGIVRTQIPVQRLYDLATDLVDGLWHKLEEVTVDVGTMVEAIRWQLPRLARLVSLTPDAQVSLSLALTEQARALPNERFLRWDGQSWTFQQVEEWVEGMAQHLWDRGIRKDDRVGLLMGNHPGLLLHLFALNRLGAVGCILPIDASISALQAHITQLESPFVLLDATSASLVPDLATIDTSNRDHSIQHLFCQYPRACGADAARLPLRPKPLQEWRNRPHGAEARWPSGQADAVAMVMWTAGTTGQPKSVAVTNRHWGLAALGAAAAAGLTSQDVIASSFPLHNSQGLLVAAGSAMLGGASFQLLDDTPSLWQQQLFELEATVLFAGTRTLTRLASAPLDIDANQRHLRAIVGTGLLPGLTHALARRYPEASLLSCYSTTETNFALAHLRDEKPGALGRPLLGQASLALVAVDLSTGEWQRDGNHKPLLCLPNQPGRLLSRSPTERPFPFFEGYLHDTPPSHHLFSDVFAPGDRWYASDDLLRQDQEGDFWFVDRLCQAFCAPLTDQDVFPFATTQALLQLPFVSIAAALRSEQPHNPKEPLEAAVELLPGHVFAGRKAYAALEQLASHQRPWRIHICPHMPTTSAGTVHLPDLQSWLANQPQEHSIYQRNDGTKRYQRVTAP